MPGKYPIGRKWDQSRYSALLADLKRRRDIFEELEALSNASLARKYHTNRTYISMIAEQEGLSVSKFNPHQEDT